MFFLDQSLEKGFVNKSENELKKRKIDFEKIMYLY
jgi:hypothetical protein